MGTLGQELFAIAMVFLAIFCFFVGFKFKGEHDYVCWDVRGPLWGIGTLAVELGAPVAWQAVRNPDE